MRRGKWVLSPCEGRNLIVQGVGKGMLADAPFTNEYGDSLSTFFKHVFPPHKSKDFKSYYLNEAKINDLRDAFLYGKTKQIIEYALIKGSLAINSPFIPLSPDTLLPHYLLPQNMYISISSF